MMSTIERLEAMQAQAKKKYEARKNEQLAIEAMVAAANKGYREETTLKKEVTDIMICGRRAHGSFGG
jgi:TPP-dependent indolepyruvate ferredoxin oxidoreductase alpha subunit